MLNHAIEGEPCPHCNASWDERGRHAHQGYCEVCNGEPSQLEHIARLGGIIAHYIHGTTKSSERYAEAEIHLEADRITTARRLAGVDRLPPIPDEWLP
jgi:hypothetical protein